MTARCDAVIVGAGAAGCAAALNLPRHMSALLVDRARPGEERCCGGLIAPDAQAALAGLRLELPRSVRTDPAPGAVHVTDLDSGREQTYRRAYLNVDRARFDDWLLRLASRRADFRPGTRLTGAARRDDGLELELTSGTGRETVLARFLIGADGARSKVRSRFFGNRPLPRTDTALQVTLPARPGLRLHEVLFSRRLTGFYAWAIPKSECVLVGSAFADRATARDNFDRLLAEFCRRLGLAGTVLGRAARPLTRPRSRADFCPGDSSVLLCGEAAGLVSPSSGEGISWALVSGAAAGRALGTARPGAAYSRAFGPLAARLGDKFVKSRIIFTPWTRRLALRLPWCP